MKYITEQQKNIPVSGKYDVIVCGGGVAGIAAALAAAISDSFKGINIAGLQKILSENGVKLHTKEVL